MRRPRRAAARGGQGWFKRADPRLAARAVVKAVQAHLWPSRRRRAGRHAAAEGLSQGGAGGALLEAQQLLTAHPSVLAARSSSKGYCALHCAAMAGALPMLDWLCAQGLQPNARRRPAARRGSRRHRWRSVQARGGGEAAAPAPRGLRLPARRPRRGRRGPAAAAARAGSAAGGGAPQQDAGAGGRESGRRRRARGGGRARRRAARAAAVRRGRGRGRAGATAAAAAAAARRRRADGAAGGGGGHADASNLLHQYERAAAPCSWAAGRPPRRDRAAAGGGRGAGAVRRGARRQAGAGARRAARRVGAQFSACAWQASRALFRWVEAELRLPVWLPVEMPSTCSSSRPSASPSMRAACLRAARRPAAAATRTQVSPPALDRPEFAPAATGAAAPRLLQGGRAAPAELRAALCARRAAGDALRRCRRASPLLGEELVEAHWERLEAAAQEWLAAVAHFLPITPWGAGRRGTSGRAPTAPTAYGSSW